MPQFELNFISENNLKDLSVFEGFSEQQIKEELDFLNAQIKEYSKNETIINEGQNVTIGIIIRGSAQVEKLDWNGNRNILFNIEPDSVFGESLFCTNAKVFQLTITAAEKTSVLFIDPALIRSCSKNLMVNLMKIMARNNLIFREKLDILSQRTTEEKLLQYLSIQARKNNSKDFYIPLDRQALADYLGAERTALSKVIAKLQKKGVLNSKKNHFELKTLD